MNSYDTKLKLLAYNLSKRIGRVVCLQNASIELMCDEIVAIVGSNGSGKTTLCDILSGFIAPDSGEVIIAGKTANQKSPVWFGQHGILRTFQAPRAFEQMTVLEVLVLASYISDPPSLIDSFLYRTKYNQIQHTQAVKRSEDILRLFEWDSLQNKQARELSYGQRKILATLTLRLTSGSIAICDEPTAGLDNKHAKLVMQQLLEWKNEFPGRAVIITSHDLESAAIHADRILHMERGMLLVDSHA